MTQTELTAPRVLHVDDEDDIRVIAQIAIEVVGGLPLLQCSNGPDALALAPDFHPDVFLLDWMMPEMTGEETLAKLRLIKGFENIPAIFITAKAQPEDIAHLLSIGSIDVITKPFDPLTLAATVVATLKRHAQKHG